MTMKSLSICGAFSSNWTFAQLWRAVGNYMIAPDYKIIDSRSKSMQIAYMKSLTLTSCCFFSQCTAVIKVED